jgi:hypothetical protein
LVRFIPFWNNTNLKAIHLTFLERGMLTDIVCDAISALGSLKSITIDSIDNCDRLMEVLSMKKGLQHITLENCILSYQGRESMKNMLVLPTCELKLLRLTLVKTDDNADMKNIVRGLACTDDTRVSSDTENTKSITTHAMRVTYARYIAFRCLHTSKPQHTTIVDAACNTP